MNTFTDVPSLIRVARQGMSQRAFASMIGATQSMVSRYERGLSSPPAEVVNSCMRLMHQTGNEVSLPSAEDLALQVTSKLNSPNFAPLRFVIAQLIDGVTIGAGIKPRITGKEKAWLLKP